MRVPLLLMVFLVLSERAGAQAADTAPTGLAPGERVRITAPGVDRRPARLVVFSRDSLVVKFDGDTAAHSLRTADVSLLELSRGRSRGRGALIGAGFGFLGGAALGAVVGAILEDSQCSDCVAVPALGAVGGVLGLVIGTVVGSVRGGERWQALPLGRASMQRGAAIYVTLSVAF